MIVYGHKTGLRAVWYGGRSFKEPDPNPKVNGNKEEPMVIDLVDDEPQRPDVSTAQADFEDEEGEIDPQEPYPDVLRYLDVPLGASVQRLAIPDSPEQLQTQIIVVAACTDLTIRVVTIPLDPPSPQNSDLSQLNVRSLKISGPGSHQDLITGIAATLHQTEEALGEHDTTLDASSTTSLLIASTSCTGNGLMLIHRLPAKAGGFCAAANEVLPIRRVHLRAPLMSASLSFNNASVLLITIPDAPCVKVYDPFPQTPYSRSRRGSVATTDSASSTRSSPMSESGNGKVLITLLSDSQSRDQTGLEPQRKRVLSSKWVLGGRAIITLLEDGEWGIWDLEAAGPTPSTKNQNLIKGQANVGGIMAGGSTRFALKGQLTKTVGGSNQTQNSQSASNGLIPATPHTRKTRAEGLFKGSSAIGSDRASGPRDGYLVVKSSITTNNEESVLMSYGPQNMYIPSILSYWKANTESYATARNSHAIDVPAINTAGQTLKSIDLLPRSSKQKRDNFLQDRTPPNVLVSTDSRLILLVQPLITAGTTNPPAAQTSLSNSGRSIRGSSGQDHELESIDHMLDKLDAPRPQEARFAAASEPRAKPNFGSSVMFGDDVEMGDDSPAPPLRSKLTVESSQASSRRLFS